MHRGGGKWHRGREGGGGGGGGGKVVMEWGRLREEGKGEELWKRGYDAVVEAVVMFIVEK